MALPFLAPLLIGATIGAITNPDDRLRGALMGGTLGALTGGLGASAASGSAAGSALSGATAAQGASQAAMQNAITGGIGKTAATKAAASEVAKQAASQAAKQSVASGLGQSAANVSASLGQNAMQSLTPNSIAALTNAGTMSPVATGVNASSSVLGGLATPAASTGISNLAGTPQTLSDAIAKSGGVDPGKFNLPADIQRSVDISGVAFEPTTLDMQAIREGAAPAQKLSGFDKAKAIVKDKPVQSAILAQSVLGGGQQQQAAPMQMAPIQQGSFGMPMSKEERLAMSGGDAPTFVPKGLFDEVNADLDEEERLRLLSQELQMAGMV